MSDNDWIGYDELDDLSARLRLGIGGSEWHGSLCGYLAGAGRIGKQSLLSVLQLDGDADVSPTPADLDVLERLVKQTEAELDDPELGFEPLLPSDDRPLHERAEALVDWCRGFLGGFGLAGTHAHGKLSEEAQEILRDLGSIAAAQLDFGDEGEDEDSLIEVHEFVRMAAMLLFAECVGGRGKTGSDRVH